MTNLKFRTYHKKEQKIYLVSMINFDTEEIIISQNNKPFCDTLQMNEVEIMQSTGLKDKNGKEIFEGDYIKIYDKYSEDGFVTRDEDGAWIIEGKSEWDRLAYNTKDFIEIIGNIYENPELLNS